MSGTSSRTASTRKRRACSPTPARQAKARRPQGRRAFLLPRVAGLLRRREAGCPLAPPAGLAAAAGAAEADLLREGGALGGVVRRHHWVIGRQAPLLAILLRCQAVGRAQVALQHLQLLTILQADNVVVMHGLLY